MSEKDSIKFIERAIKRAESASKTAPKKYQAAAFGIILSSILDNSNVKLYK